MPTYLVAGVSGHTGAVVAQSLLDQKQKVRVLVRDAAKGERWKKRGAEVAVGSLEDAHALAAAFRGADAAYLLVPPPPHDATGVLARSARIVAAFVQTVSGSHLKHVVFLSSVGAQHKEGTGIIQGLHAAEEALRTLQNSLSPSCARAPSWRIGSPCWRRPRPGTCPPSSRRTSNTRRWRRTTLASWPRDS